VKQQFDLIINGGGMAGATLAWGINYILGKSNALKIAIIEASPSEQDHAGFDSRVIALSYGSRQLLEQLGLWQAYQSVVTPIHDISVTDRGHFGQTILTPQEYQVPHLGYVVELADSGKLLLDKLSQTSVTWFRPNSITQLTQQQTEVTVTLRDGEQLTAPLIVAADGGLSTVRQLLKLSNEQTSFEQSAIIANVSTSQAHQGVAYERFSEHGPIALLPMSQGRSSLVWSMRSDEVESVMALSEPDFLAKLQQAFGYRLGTFEKTGKRVSYPLIQTLAATLTHHRVAFVGNAAQALHPIAGQGFNLGLRDVAALIYQLSDALVNGQDIGEFSVLNQYSGMRQHDRDNTILATSGLVSIFSNKHWPLVIGRNIGLSLSNCIDALKKPVAHQMLGWNHNLPILKPHNNMLKG